MEFALFNTKQTLEPKKKKKTNWIYSETCHWLANKTFHMWQRLSEKTCKYLFTVCISDNKLFLFIKKAIYMYHITAARCFILSNNIRLFPFWITALSYCMGLHNTMKLQVMLYRATQDGWVRVKIFDKIWSTGKGNGNSLQYSCLKNPMDSMKRQQIWHQKMSVQVWSCLICSQGRAEGNYY